jgi:hypothetical protein
MASDAANPMARSLATRSSDDTSTAPLGRPQQHVHRGTVVPSALAHLKVIVSLGMQNLTQSELKQPCEELVGGSMMQAKHAIHIGECAHLK